MICQMLTIYLAGDIPKGDEEGKDFKNWRLIYQEVLAKIFDGAKFIDPWRPDKDENDPVAVFGEDCKHIKEADLIVIKAEEKVGAGTAMEFVIAKYFKKPVVTVIPKDTHHRRSNIVFGGQLVKDWVHPFIFSMSDYVVERVEEIAEIKDQILKDKPKDITFIDTAIKRAEDSGVS